MQKGDDFPTVFAVHLECDEKPLLDAELMGKFTKKDGQLSRILYYAREGWPERRELEVAPEKAATGDLVRPGKIQRSEIAPEKAAVSAEYSAYYSRKDELTVEKDCILWGHRVVVPAALRRDVLRMLHSTHMGMSLMKQLARNYVWWPGLDKDIETLVKLCYACKLNQQLPRKAVPHPWIRTQNPWERIHIDYAGPFHGNMWLVLIDSYSKWIEIVNMHKNIQAPATIRSLRNVFSRYGLPKILVSDNAPQLTKSHEFDQFCRKNGINHVPIPSYHPSSNGQCESVVGKFKLAMKKMCTDKSDIESNVPEWLLNYHNTAHSATGIEPSVLMMGRRLRSPLSLINPLSSSGVKQEVTETTERLRSEKTLRRFNVGDPVLFRDVLHKAWIKGTVTKISDKIYEIESESGKSVTKHIDHVVANTGQSQPETERIEKDQVNAKVPSNPGVEESAEVTRNSGQLLEAVREKPNLVTITPEPEHSIDNSVTEVQPCIPRPRRNVIAPHRLNYDKLGG
jgi:transposase InsO family protein